MEPRSKPTPYITGNRYGSVPLLSGYIRVAAPLKRSFAAYPQWLWLLQTYRTRLANRLCITPVEPLSIVLPFDIVRASRTTKRFHGCHLIEVAAKLSDFNLCTWKITISYQSIYAWLQILLFVASSIGEMPSFHWLSPHIAGCNTSYQTSRIFTAAFYLRIFHRLIADCSDSPIPITLLTFGRTWQCGFKHPTPAISLFESDSVS